jgi:hypothetical protein
MTAGSLIFASAETPSSKMRTSGREKDVFFIRERVDA